MKKFILITLLTLLNISVNSQDLSRYIPSQSKIVMKLNADALNNKMSIESMNALPVFREMLSGRDFEKFNNLQDFGFDLTKAAYMYTIVSDSLFYAGFILPIGNQLGFDNLILELNGKRISNNILKFEEDLFLSWTDDVALFIIGDAQDSYIQNNDVYEKYGLSEVTDQNSWEDVTEAAPETHYYDGEIEVEEIVEDIIIEEYEVIEEEEKIIVEDGYAVDQQVEEEYYEEYNEYQEYDDNDNWYESYADEKAKKDSLNSIWLTEIISTSFTTKTPKHNKDISDIINSEDDASIYVDYGSLMEDIVSLNASDINMSFMYPASGITAMQDMMAMYSGMKLKADLNFDKGNMNLQMEYIMDDELAALYDGMMDSKLSKSFYKYIDMDNVIGLFSMSYNTESLLEMYPKIIGKYLDALTFSKGTGEAISSLISTILDEEAVAKILPGNAVLLFDGFSTQKIQYTTYDYDEDFNRIEKTTEKEEELPSVVLMIESQDQTLFNVLLEQGLKYDVLTKNDNGYVSKTNSEIPFQSYLCFKGDLMFISNDAQKIADINNGTTNKSSNKVIKSLLKKNNSAIYMDTKKLFDAIPYSPYSARDKESWAFAKEHFDDVIFYQFQKDKNTLVSSLKLSTPLSETNSWEYFWNTLNEFYLIQTK